MNIHLARVSAQMRILWVVRFEPPRKAAERGLRMATTAYHDCARNECPYGMLNTLRSHMEHQQELVALYRDAYGPKVCK